MKYVIRRNRRHHYRRRVPRCYRHMHTSGVVQVPLDTDSQVIASQRAVCVSEILETYWRTGEQSNTDSFATVLEFLRRTGFKYLSKDELVQSEDLQGLIHRIDIAYRSENAQTTAAMLGNVRVPRLPLSKVGEEYIQFEQANLLGHSEEQMRIWRNARIRAFNNFISIVGDKDFGELSREDLLAFRQYWADKIAGGMSANTANKEISYLRKALMTAKDNHNLSIDVVSLFSRMAIKDMGTSTRCPFDTSFIIEVLLDREKLDMSEECQLLLYAMADTGARISELVGLSADDGDICLGGKVPHIKIRANGVRSLKTPHSHRDIPLVGSSLYAFEQLPKGFVHYLGKNSLISSTINKYLRENNILPSKDHSLYSLRHSFEDRLTAVEPPEKVQAALMGHKYQRPRYGAGPTLEQKHSWLKKIALPV